MGTDIRVVSLNVEQSKHLDALVPFLTKEMPDVFCAQEFMERDITTVESILGATSVFIPMTIHPSNGNPGVMGVAIFSRHTICTWDANEYHEGAPEGIVEHDLSSPEAMRKTIKHFLLSCEIEKDGEIFTVCTTHFTWTPKGDRTDDVQRHDMQELLKILKEKSEFVVCGDFNAARGGEIFAELSSRYKDNIPPEYTTSIDGDIHHAGPLPYMVDGLFTTKEYSATNVALYSGVSDHCAIVATVTKTN